MRRLLAVALIVLAACVSVRAQTAPIVGTTVRTTSTAAGSVRVGCTQSGTCTGGLTAGAIDVASVTSAGFIEIANNVPGSQTFRLVNNAGTLQWNGIALATGASLSGTLNTIPVFTGANSVGNSIMTQSGTTITVASTLNATTLGGTLSTATQNSVTTMTGLTSVGTIATGTWNATTIGLAKGGTNADLSGTGGTSQFLRQNSVGATVTVVRPTVSDLSDASNVALLNASNTFTAFGTNAFDASGAGANSVRVRNTAAGVANIAHFQLGNDASSNAGTLYTFSSTYTTSNQYVANAVLLEGTLAGGLGLSASNGAGTIRLYTNGAQRWGVNAAGDWTFGASAHIADSNGTPTIGSGFGTSPSIAGTDYAMLITNGVPAGSSGVVNFGHTWTTAPVCVGVTAAAASPVGLLISTTTLAVESNGSSIYILCRGY
jgi:hypothetical protein